MMSSVATIHPSPQHSSTLPPSSPLSPLPPSVSPTPLSGRHRRRWTMQNFSSDGADSSDLALARRWIEECTGCVQEQSGFREYLQDGALLCEVVQGVRPDLIKRIKRVKSPFAWRENLVFFLEACESLGLKGSQLFSPEDLITSAARTSAASKAKGLRGENERRLRNVAITIFWLSRTLRRLPDYTGPLLDLDLSALGDWEHSEKLTVTHDRGLNPEPATPPHTRKRSYTSPEPAPPPKQQQQQHNKNSPSPPPPTSPYHSPTIKVKRVESIVSHTDQTSYPQVIVHVGRRGHRRNSSTGPSHSRSNSVTENSKPKSEEAIRQSNTATPATPLSGGPSSVKVNNSSIFDQLAESEQTLSDLTQELTHTEEVLARQLSPKHSQTEILTDSHSRGPLSILSSGVEEEEEEEGVSLQELINAELQLNSHKSPLDSHNSLPQDTHRSPSVTSSTLSEVSTIVPRELASSRCSGISFTEDTAKTSAAREVSGTESELSSKRRLQLAPTESSHPLSHSSSQSLNGPHHPAVLEEPETEVRGHTPLFRNSPLLDVEALLSSCLAQPDSPDNAPPEEREDDSTDFPSVTVSAPSPSPEPPPPLVHPSSPSAAAATTASGERLPHLEQITEEESASDQESLPQSADWSPQYPLLPLRSHPAITALKEDYHKPFHSSTSSLDSTACSVIEVSYCYHTGSSESDKPPSDHSPSVTSNYSSLSENENDSFEAVIAEPVNHYLVDLEAIESQTVDTDPDSSALASLSSQSEVEQADLETIPEEMAVTTQVMRIYPAQSVGEASGGVAVPHHRVHLPSGAGTNGPESPSKRTATAHGSSTVLYMMSTQTESGTEQAVEEKEDEVPLVKAIIPTSAGGSSNGSAELSAIAPPVMTMMAGVLQEEDEEEDEEEEGDAAPVMMKRRRKTSKVLPVQADTGPSFRPHLSLTVPLKDGGGGSVVRVRSDALPLTLHADKLTVPDGDSSTSKEDTDNRSECADLSDFNSVAVEIGSSLDSLSSSRPSIATSNYSASSLALSHRSVSSSALGSQGELHAHMHRGNQKHRKQRSDDSFINSVLAPSHGRAEEKVGLGAPAKGVRPYSAPTRATSDSILPPLSSSSSSYSSDSPKMLKLRSRKTSAEDERQKRMANIAQSARAALTFTAIRSKKTESLPRDHQLEHSRSYSGSKSVGSEEELLGASASSSSLLMKSTAATVSSSESANPSSPSGSFNLHSLSIDETRKASLNEMEEIWKLVENESGGSSTSLDTGASVGGSSVGLGGGGGGGRGPPSIALERHMSPQHTPSDRRELGRRGGAAVVGRQRARDEPTSPAHNSERVGAGRKTSGGVSAGKDRVESRHGHATLDTSEIELGEAPEEIPLHSTPKKPGATYPAALNDSLLGSGQKASLVTSKGIDSLLTTLRSLGGGGEGRDEEGGGRGGQTEEEEKGLRMLEQMLHSTTFKRAQKVHDTVHQLVHHDQAAPLPAHRRVVPTAQETRHHFHHHTEPSPEVDELRALLRDPHMQAVMFCHDRVSSEDYFLPRRYYPRVKQDPVDLILSGSVLHYIPSSPLDNSLPLSRDVPSARKEDATIVYLQRTNRPLGCTIYKQVEAVFVGKLLKGCDAELSKVLREGDELLEVNGVPVAGRSTDEIVRLMSGEAGMTLAFTIIPIHDDNIDLNYEPKYVRAHFYYNPKTDEEIPCQPLGLGFEKSDILEISNQDDPDWWQARKVFDDGAESLPGLIPARHRQQQREAVTRSYLQVRAMDEQRKKKGLMSKLSRKKKKTVYYNQGQQQGLVAVGDEVVTYEDVMKMDPHSQWRRPIVLIGASGVGKGTLIRKLINSDHTHFAAVVQHTTRAIRPGEVDAHTYHFVSREEFELDVLHERFLEHQEIKGQLYGTSVLAVKKIVESGRVPVLGLQPQSLKRVRYSGLMPYVVLVASPRLERLVVTRRVGPERPRRRLSSSVVSMDNLDRNQIYTEPELQHLLVESRVIESQYSHYFDWVIVNDDLSVASDMLKEVARRAEEETQWVPATWLTDHGF